VPRRELARLCGRHGGCPAGRLRGALPSFRRPRHRRLERLGHAVPGTLVGAPTGAVGFRDAVSDRETRSEGTLRVGRKRHSQVRGKALDGQAPQRPEGPRILGV